MENRNKRIKPTQGLIYASERNNNATFYALLVIIIHSSRYIKVLSTSFRIQRLSSRSNVGTLSRVCARGLTRGSRGSKSRASAQFLRRRSFPRCIYTNPIFATRKEVPRRVEETPRRISHTPDCQPQTSFPYRFEPFSSNISFHSLKASTGAVLSSNGI